MARIHGALKLKLMLAAQGQRASGIDRVMGSGDSAEDSLHFVKR